MDIKVYLNSLRQKGNLAYEYNPLHNYQTDIDLYLIDNTYIVPKGQAVNLKNGELLVNKGTSSNKKWTDKRGRIINNNIKLAEDGQLWAKAGSLVDFDTDLLNFDLDHPVEIEVLPSYDGSVNLILNDDKNIPRLINSRFSVREKDTYEIVDRIGENDTNIYNSKTFDKDTSLYFLCESNPDITYLGFVKGVLPVGLYCFYFTYCDSDENESDYIAETGLIPVFIGNDSNPISMDGGIKNQISHKGIHLRLNNLDKSYNYFKVYYVRYFADYNQNRVYEGKKLYKKYPINSNTVYLQITGNEEAEDIDPNILNITRFNPKSILTLAQCKNMLFFGNIVKNSDNYRELTDCALRIVPLLNIGTVGKLNERYDSTSGDFAYYDSLNIYNKTGYFNQEYYRFGVVFIYLNGTLSNVYNTLGGTLDSPTIIQNEQHVDNPKLLNLTGSLFNTNGAFLIRNYVKVDDLGWVKTDTSNYTLTGSNINSKGVCLLNFDLDYDDKTIFSIKFKIPGEVSKYLREDLGIRGLFFVRLKCVPNILALCFLLRTDETLKTPVLEGIEATGKKYYTECFVGSEDRILKQDYSSRLYTYLNIRSLETISTTAFAGICPDFLLNQPYYNQIFNGGRFKLLKVTTGSNLTKRDRFYNQSYDVKYNTSNRMLYNAYICTVTEDVPTVAIKDKTFKLEVGKAEEAYRFEYAEYENGVYNAGKEDYQAISKATNLVRGKYSPYLAIYSESGDLETGCLYNIYQDLSISTTLEFLNRMNSSEPFYAISDRHTLYYKDEEYVCWRGDCYINQFTYRLVRNFNDPSLPNNDKIIDVNTWKDNYDASNPEKWQDISRSDVNAVQLGSWITFKVRSAMNYALRSVDHSYVAEEALMGAPRSFYPRTQLLQRGENKIPDSYLFNDAYRASLGFKCYFTLQDVNYIKDTFSNRIQYSEISIQDSYKNNYRSSLSTYFRDYSQEYGSIQKLIGFEGYLLVVFEHAIGIAVINERVIAGSSDGEPVFINSKNVLPEELTIISDTYGTQWGDSVVKSEAGYVYGIDTIAKKIWRVKGQQIEILSDFKVNKFLIDNITLGERELYPTIGLRNVKSHYNNNKKDIIFTFYDDAYLDEEKTWSLCYNELLELFVTFYSWIPSYSENIDTKFFTFDRNTAKYLALLNKCNYSIPENQGILVDNPVCEMEDITQQSHPITNNSPRGGVPGSEVLIDQDDDLTHVSGNDNLVYVVYKWIPPKLYYTSKTTDTYTLLNEDGTTEEKNEEKNISNDRYEFKDVKFEIEKDHWGFWNMFDINTDNEIVIKDGIEKEVRYNEIVVKEGSEKEVKEMFDKHKVILLYITPYFDETSDIISGTIRNTKLHTEVIALTLKDIVENPQLTKEQKTRAGLTTDFYLHGQAGIFDVVEDMYPTYWYGKYHPFEFEFVVNDKIGQQKIFENLVLISNKAEPESFHFEIEGDNYEFSSDKRTMYFRQEATKELYQTLGSDILFNRYYTDIKADKLSQELYYRTKNNEYTDKYTKLDKVYPIEKLNLVLQFKSTIFPLYYERIDTYNDIYHNYQLMENSDGVYDFLNLSGSEISWNRDLNLFNIITHIKNNPIDLVGRLRGNSRYKEGKWSVQIPSIIFNLKNEDVWTNGIPPIIINSLYVPNDITDNKISFDKIPNVYTKSKDRNEDLVSQNIESYIQIGEWTYRKEARIRDKWMKVRVRYSGKNLAIIHSIATLYNLSYS